MEPHILIKYASRSRPERFFEGLHNIIDMAADKESYTVLCMLDADDMSIFSTEFQTSTSNRYQLPSFNTQMDLVHHKAPDRVCYDFGTSKSKIDAINRPIWPTMQWDILVNFSDDMRFTVYGYDHLIREGIRCNGPDVFLHYPDSTAKNMLPTMSIMDRTYFQRDGYIYHPSYKSLWCDNEAMDVAQLRGRYHYVDTQIFDHYHPAYGHVPWDEQYTRQQQFWSEDEANYNYRKSQNFFL